LTSYNELKFSRGGGNFVNPDFKRAPPPLRWMVYEARVAGLKVADFRPEHYDDDLVFKKSLKASWWILEMLPVRHMAFHMGGGFTTVYLTVYFYLERYFHTIRQAASWIRSKDLSGAEDPFLCCISIVKTNRLHALCLHTWY